MRRRTFLTLSALGATLAPRRAPAMGDDALFDMPLLDDGGPSWNARPNAIRRVLQEVELTTSIQVVTSPGAVQPALDDLLTAPLVVWHGDRGFDPLPPDARSALATWLGAGGMLFIDSFDARADGAFDAAVRRELGAILPEATLEPIGPEHVLWRSFYLIGSPPGRLRADNPLLGVTRDDRLVVIYSTNDVLGAWSRDPFGAWEYDMFVGGDLQREMTMRFGVNLALYATCLDYKEDQVHVNYLLRQRRWRIP